MHKLQGGPGSVRFGYGLGMERFERFRFSVPAVPLRRGLLCVSVQDNREDRSGSGFGSWKTGKTELSTTTAANRFWPIPRRLWVDMIFLCFV